MDVERPWWWSPSRFGDPLGLIVPENVGLTGVVIPGTEAVGSLTNQDRVVGLPVKKE